jgi:hypothetical protein
MSTITVSRPDVTCEEVSDALRRALGPSYHVLPGTAIDHSSKGNPPSELPDTIVVGVGSNRWFRSEVTISHNSTATVLHVTPGGLPGTWPGGLKLINRLWIAREVRQALKAAPDLR